MAFECATERVHSPAGSIHVLWALRTVKGEQLLAEPFGMTRLDFRLRSRQKELLDTFVPEALDHMYIV